MSGVFRYTRSCVAASTRRGKVATIEEVISSCIAGPSWARRSEAALQTLVANGSDHIFATWHLGANRAAPELRQ